jgi:hypothetical protein
LIFGHWLLLCLVGPVLLKAQIPDFPLSTTSDAGCKTCYDTVRVLMFKKIYDLSPLLPEWKPVVDWEHVEAVEGIVEKSSDTYYGNHVSQEDFSAFHYTHDFGFNIKPDSAYRRVLARRVYTGHEIGHASDHPDTVINRNIHVEWESGLAASNEGNPCAEANRRGESCGFFSAGHQRGEIIWNWPTIGDWVHCEGVWIWDRGHPPAYTELHPLRMCATRRAMGAYIPRYPGAPDSIFATEIDIFVSGDGGALLNNREGQPEFIRRTKMRGRDYTFKAFPISPRPSPTAELRWRIENRPGDSFKGHLGIQSDGVSLSFTIPWWTEADTAVFAKTVYCWWEDENRLLQPDFQCYEIRFESLYFNQRKDVTSRPEKVIWIEAGGQYFCVNEMIEGQDIFKDGEAKTFRREWNIGKALRIYAQAGQTFRVHVGGWESDGISRVFGHLLDPDMACTRSELKKIHQHLWPATPFGLHGCLDDLIGEVHDIKAVDDLADFQEFEAMSFGGESELEPCPGANTIQNDVFRLRYSIRRVK